MFSNPMVTMMWLFAAVSVMFLLSHVKINVVKINPLDKNCPEEAKKAFFKKHPGAKWMIDMSDSFDKVDEEIKNFALYMKEKTNANAIESMISYVETIIVMETCQSILADAYKKLRKIGLRKADRIVQKIGHNAATEKYFGVYIEDFYFSTFIIKEFRNAFDNGEKEFHLTKELTQTCKDRAHEIRMRYVA